VPSYADAERAFHRGRYEEAASMFEAYSESEPDNAWGHYMLGLAAWKTGDAQWVNEVERTGIEPVTPCLQSRNRSLAGASRR
jgi:predicted Zn-dependent protease